MLQSVMENILPLHTWLANKCAFSLKNVVKEFRNSYTPLHLGKKKLPTPKFDKTSKLPFFHSEWRLARGVTG